MTFHPKRSVLPVLALLAAVFPCQSFGQEQTLTYTISREGDVIGEHAIAISTDQDERRVSTTTHITIEGFFTTAYAYQFSSQEVWRGDAIQHFRSKTTENGETSSLTIKNDGNRLIAHALTAKRDQIFYIDTSIPPANAWRMPKPDTHTVFDVITGETLDVRVQSLGNNVFAFHGQLTREVQYDTNGTLTGLKFPDKSGAIVTYHQN